MLYSFDCMPIMIVVYHWHSLLNASYMWTLATHPLLTMPVCCRCFGIFLLPVPTSCVFNLFFFFWCVCVCVHKNRLFQNLLLLSPETILIIYFFNYYYFFHYYLLYLIALLLIMVYASCVLIDGCPKHQNYV